MTKYTCTHCGGDIDTEYNEIADIYMHWCVDCDREFNTPDMSDLGEPETLCPICTGGNTEHTAVHMAECYQDINDPDERGMFITIYVWLCHDCRHEWEVQHGRPLNVECDCD